MKIIIQAGGLGSRMKDLVNVKPKCLVPARYTPIIFHLFEKYKTNDFIIIGDYKFDVFDKYLSAFAKDVNYMLLRAEGKGNAAGIKEAVSLVPDGEPFMIIWSDIILSDQFEVSEFKSGCQVGVVDFPCSWSLIDGQLSQEKKAGMGVGGLYVFDSKKWFDDFPKEGSFTHWLANKDISLNPISLMGSIDVGTLEAYNEISPTANRCRPYNRIEFTNDKVIKRGLTEEALKLIDRETLWYERVKGYGFNSVPEVHSKNPLTMDRINGDNIFSAELSASEKEVTLSKIVSALKNLHSFETANASPWDLYEEYFQKTIKRLHSIISSIPFGYDESIKINGIECNNIVYTPDILRNAVIKTLMNTKYGPIHGDCQLTNTLIDDAGEIFFIDARGYFGKSKILGDVRYDWAKVFYAINGNFDQFNIKNFELDISKNSVEFKIASGGWEHLTDAFFDALPSDEGDRKQIELIHSIIWLSLASHAWEDFDSMCVAFYNGTLLFNEWLNKYG